MNNSHKNFIEFSKPFINAAKNVFETMIFTKLDAQKPTIKTDQLSKGDITSILGITGEFSHEGKTVDYRGMLVLSWPQPTYIKMANAMLMENHTEFNKEIADVGNEISNMIMGNAKRELSVMGYSSSMAIPSSIEGKDHNIRYPSGTTVILIPINSAHGPMFMEICYRED